MSMGYRGKTTNLRREVTAVQAESERESMFGEIPGKIVSFDAEKQTATIQPLFKPKHNGVPVDMPELQEVPVRFPRAGGGAITHPVKEGDVVTLRPQMRSSEHYHTDGEYVASDTRSMSLSDMEAFLDGGESLKDPIQNFDAENMHLRANEDGSHGIRVSEDGKFALDGAQGDVIDIVAQIAELLGTDTDTEHRAQYEQLAEKLRAMSLA